MPLVLCDASALAKRFVAEVGTQTVNAVFSSTPRDHMVVNVMGYSETFAALLRKFNQGVLSAVAFNAAQALLRTEVIDDPDFVVLGLCASLTNLSIYDSAFFVARRLFR